MSCKKLTIAAAALALTVLTSNAAVVVLVDDPYSASPDPMATPALWVTGTWDLSSQGGSYSVPGLVNWALDLSLDSLTVAGIRLYVVSVEGQHLVGGPPPTFGASLGMSDLAGNAGTITSFILHDDALGDAWILGANINPAGTMNFDIRAAHEGEAPRVPDAGATSVLLGVALVGLAVLRRKLC